MSKNKHSKLKTKKKKLWIITELYYPENNQTGYYMTQIGEGLTEIFDVKIICGQPNYAFRGTVAPKHEIHKDVEIFRVRGMTLDKNVLIFRLINMITHGCSVFFSAILKIKKNDEVLTVSAPPSLPFLSALAAKIKGVSYSLIIQDKYPETIVAVKKAKPESLLIKLFNRLNKWLYSNARKIIVVGRDMKELVLSQLQPDLRNIEKVAVIPNWAALEEIEPRPKSENELLKKHGLLEKFVFLYAGNMGHPQDVESIIKCAEELKTHPFIRFLFIGNGVKRKWIESRVAEKRLVNVILLDPMPRESQTLFLNACDVGFVSLVNKMFGVAMPSRTYNFLAAGKPILALTERNSEIERVIKEDDLGWTVEPENPKMLLEKIIEIYNSKNDLKKMGESARKNALKKYNAELSIEKYKFTLKDASDNE